MKPLVLSDDELVALCLDELRQSAGFEWDQELLAQREQALDYPDPLSGAEPWTIGYGHTGPEVRQGLTWTAGQAMSALHIDVAKAVAALDATLPWWRRLDDVRQDALAELCFNMGIGSSAEPGRPGHGLRSFTQMLSALQAARYGAAADALLASRWATQVGGRGGRLARMLGEGVRPDRQPIPQTREAS